MKDYAVHSLSQDEPKIDSINLTSKDRRAFLGSMLRLIIRRYCCGQPVLRSDLIQLVSLADDARGSEGTPV